MKLKYWFLALCGCPALMGAQTKFASQQIYPAKKEIYRKGWIDFNKNGKKDVYEDPEQPIDLRIKDLLSQMTLEEKTCQLATLYGYQRVLKDDLPTPEWKEAVWKDGIANIDEHLNGLKKTPYSYPYSLHAEAINEVQRWFVEQTRLGIPVDFSNEGIHGLNHDRSTPLPAPISIGSTWDKALVREAGDIVGREAKALGDATWPESEIIPTPMTDDEQQSIRQAVEQARRSDVIVAVVGEDAARCGENNSRTGLNLPGRQLQLVQALQATGKPVVLVLINGQPLTICWENRYVPAILEAWFPNAWGGNAIAEALFGDYNPGGKLSVTFPKTIGQIEYNFPFKPGAHEEQASEGPNGYGKTSVYGALYPFGFGLSYTTFEYANLKVSPEKGHTQSDIHVSVDVKNTGSRAGDEVVQLYVKDLYSSVTTYVSKLRGFERIHLEPGETKTVQFVLKPSDLELLDKNMQWTVEPGDFKVCIGSSSEDIRLEKGFRLD